VKPTKPLNYRAPRDEAHVNRIATQLLKRDAGFWLRTLLMFALGIPLSFVGPALLASIFHAAFLKARIGWNPAWLNLFLISSLIIIPILYITEWRSRGDFLVEEMRWQGTTADHFYSASSYGEWESRQSMAAGAAYAEILLFAPRQVFSAIAGIRQRVHITSDELHRASEIVRALQLADGGVPIAQLRRGEESKESLRRILRYLQFHDWIDISKKGDRAWLISTARKRLKP
jgi:hypothetical protein